MRIHLMRTLTAAAVLAAPALTMAQVSAARAQTFRDRDKNHDGVLTLEEYGGHPGNFRAIDANGDGVLSYDEFVNRYREGNENAPAQVPGNPQVTGEVPLTPVDAFATMDRNGNGVIDRGEWRSPLAPASFARLDRNHDGVVTRDEFASPLPFDSAEARFGAMDVNNNGYINRNEWRGESLSFDAVDRNGDNRITMDEYLSRGAGYGYGTLDSRFAQLDRNRKGWISRGEWRGERLSFDAVDRNGDNRITRDEYLQQGADGYPYGYGSNGMEGRFAQMDRNRDGVVTRGEWQDSTPFRNVDRNNDGVVTLREYLNAPVVYEQPGGGYDQYGQYGTSQFRALDRNGNGYIERREWTSDYAEFDRMDRNGDGRLTASEFEGSWNTGTTRGTYERFRRMDLNGDGVIARREWDGTSQSFSAYDRNGDGVISRDEFLNYSNYNY
jgi:Ca2+-binding EF-hand superfamily protein